MVHLPENGTCEIRTKQALYISTDAKCCYDGYGGRSSCGYGDGIWLDGMTITCCWGCGLEL